MDQQTEPTRLVAVVSGALSLATLTVGESSPFRGIARRVFVGDLSEDQSRALITEELAAGGIRLTRRAVRHLLEASMGDAYLIRELCQRSAEHARGRPSSPLRAGTIERLLQAFLREEVHHYAPLQEAVRMIEDDPDLLQCILLLLSHGTVPRSELPLPLSPDVDPLYLTGVVEQVGEEGYRIQNRIYRDFLAQHFHPGHVGHLLAMAGRWDAAIDYLKAGIDEGNERARADLLPATMNSIYASEDLGQAAHFLIRGLSAGFGVVDARVWNAQPQDNLLRLVGRLGPDLASSLWSNPGIPTTADRLEARAYRERRAMRGKEVGRHVWRAIPLMIAGKKPVAVVTVCDDLLAEQATSQRERDLLLMGYLNQAARAWQAVNDRRRELELAGRMQASLLPSAPPDLSGWQIAATFRPARETSGDFYDFIPLPEGQLGIVIADVADKGMGAALYMALSRTLIRTYAADFPGRPDLVLQTVNDRILADTGADLFVTVFLGILDPANSRLTYCNAGHHPPLWLGPGAETGAREGETERIQPLPGTGIALGVVQEPGWGHSTIELDPGATLLLYTDGVVDAHDAGQERFGYEGMLSAALSNAGQPAGKLQAEILSSLQQFTGDQAQFDDITLLVIHREEIGN
jgi:serine phosphatase RsbU (regulator of sigma subunit)